LFSILIIWWLLVAVLEALLEALAETLAAVVVLVVSGRQQVLLLFLEQLTQLLSVLEVLDQQSQE
jgi:hypothetical protein